MPSDAPAAQPNRSPYPHTAPNRMWIANLSIQSSMLGGSGSLVCWLVRSPGSMWGAPVSGAPHTAGDFTEMKLAVAGALPPVVVRRAPVQQSGCGSDLHLMTYNPERPSECGYEQAGGGGALVE